MPFATTASWKTMQLDWRHTSLEVFYWVRRGAYERLEICLVQCVMTTRSMLTVSFPKTRWRFYICYLEDGMYLCYRFGWLANPSLNPSIQSFLLIPFVALPTLLFAGGINVRLCEDKVAISIREAKMEKWGGSWNAAWKCGMAATPRLFKPAQWQCHIGERGVDNLLLLLASIRHVTHPRIT